MCPDCHPQIGHINDIKKENRQLHAQLAQQANTHRAELQKQIDTHNANVSTINANMSDLKAQLQQQIATHKSNISQLTKTIQQQQNKIANLESKVGHVENGTLVFRVPRDWPSNNTYIYKKDPHYKPTMIYKDISVMFTKVYDVPPAVTWSVGAFFDNNVNVNFAVELHTVTTRSFTLRASCPNDVYEMFYHLVLEWQSVPR